MLPYLNYYAVFDVDFESQDIYKYMRNHYYDELMDGTRNMTASGAFGETLSHTGSTTKQEHSLYIMIDYCPSQIATMFAQGYTNGNFFFMLKSTQA